jgi:HupE / UreJ protein
MSTLRNLALMFVLLLAGPLAQAHIASNGFLTLSVQGSRVSGAIELAIRDGELAVGLDRDGNGKVTWRELKLGQEALQNYMQGHLRLTGADGPCRLQFAPVEVNDRVDGSYLWLPITAECGSALQRLFIEYKLLDAEDPSHRGLLTLFANGAAQTAVLGGGTATRQFELNHVSSWSAFVEYLRAGIWHIWSGIDHLLFLLSLLLPAVLLRRQNRWEAVPIAGPALLNIIKVVTAFTLAHSITLSLAAFDVIRLPSRLTESVIAASIIIAALNNVFPRVTEGRWRIAFAFGLLHGFGFASVLAEMGLPQGARLISLVAFNLGVEAGQLVVVLAVMPLAYFLRATQFYRRGIMPWGSSAIACLALFWFVQRALL